jgi:hypothetical protein
MLQAHVTFPRDNISRVHNLKNSDIGMRHEGNKKLMSPATIEAMYIDRNLEVHCAKIFDGLSAFKHIHAIMPPIGSIDRVVIKFSDIPSIATTELYYLLAELAADPLFDNVEIDVTGLRGNVMDKVAFINKKTFASSDNFNDIGISQAK